MNVKLSLDQIMRVIQEVGAKHSESGPWITVARGLDYRINVANTVYVRRIDIIGFLPPRNVEGIILLGREYNRIMAQMDLSKSNLYVTELFRCLLMGMKSLPQRTLWSRHSAPQMVLEPNLAHMMVRLHQTESRLEDNKRRRSIFRPIKIVGPAKEYLASEEEIEEAQIVDNKLKLEAELPPLDFDENDPLPFADTVVNNKAKTVIGILKQRKQGVIK